MKKTMTKLAIAAALLAVVAGVASAQAMKAEIPFAFRAGNLVMAPGSYVVQVSESARTVQLTNYDSRQSALLIFNVTLDAARDWRTKGAPVLAFDCGAGRCALSQVWTGGEHSAISVGHGRRGTQEASLTLIRLVNANGD